MVDIVWCFGDHRRSALQLKTLDGEKLLGSFDNNPARYRLETGGQQVEEKGEGVMLEDNRITRVCG